jgi:serine phosphatase RsbU (regulator of sigma subunit)
MFRSFRKILRNSSARILILIFGGIIFITGFFLVFGYFNQVKLYKDAVYQKLEGIAVTTALSIDGDQHEYLLRQYRNKGDIITREQDSIYAKIYHHLKNVEVDANLNSPVYTLFKVDIKGGETKFFYGVNSSDATPDQTFRDEYKQFPEVLVTEYSKGSTIPAYESENGYWISAFHPFTNYNGEVVGVVEVDEKFNAFINRVNNQILWSSCFSLLFISILAYFIIRSIRKILSKEEEMTKDLIASKLIIEEKNKDITDSINYAKKIQDAILPSLEYISSALPNSFVFFNPRDVVSGDFYWYSELDDKLIIIASDCTGHGVPGALMSMIGTSLLNEIVNHRDVTNPGEILDQLDLGIQKAFEKYTNQIAESKDGMDISVCTIDLSGQKLLYAGAMRPLIKISNGQLQEYKGDRFPIGGGTSYNKSKFRTQEVMISKGDFFYIFSDGFPDQFGGEKGKKFMNKSFKKLLIQIHKKSALQQSEELKNALESWKGTIEQVDDVLVVGFGI